jgi:hypothetical protein
MTPETASQTALIVLTVAVSIQTVAMIALAIGVTRARRQSQAEFERRYQELSTRIEEAVRPIRQTADAVQQLSHRASAAIDRVDHAVTTARSVIGLPRNLVTVSVATLAGALLRRWSRRSTTARAANREMDASRAVH